MDLYKYVIHLNFTHKQSDDIFRAGDQGFWNYIANKYFFSNGKGVLRECTVEANPDRVGGCKEVNEGTYVMHYVGRARRYRFVDHCFPSYLLDARDEYYRRISGVRAYDEVRRFGRLVKKIPGALRRRLLRNVLP